MIDLWEVRKLERSEDVGNCVNREVGISGSGGTFPTRIVVEDVGNCVNREVGISGSGGTFPTRIVVMNNSKGK